MHNQHWSTNTLFHGLSEQLLQSIASHVYEIAYAEHDTIIQEGDSGDFMYMISKDYVEVYHLFRISEVHS